MTVLQFSKLEANRRFKKVGKHVYSFDAEFCPESGEEIWTTKNQRDFNSWLGELYRSDGNSFYIQKIRLTQGLRVLIEEFLKDFPGAQELDVIRACVRVYLDCLKDANDVCFLDSVYQRPDYRKLLNSGTTIEVKKVRFIPRTFMEIEGWAKTFELSSSSVVVGAVERIMACYFVLRNNEDAYFAKRIQDRVTAIVLAAA